MKSSMRSTVAKRLGALAAAIILIPAAAQAQDQACQPLALSLSHVANQEEPTHIAALATAERVKERTGGQLVISVFPNGSLGATADTDEQASVGSPVISWTDSSYMSEYGVPEMAATAAPFFYKTVDDLMALIESDLYRGWTDKLQAQGIRVLSANWYFGQRHILSKKAFPNAADLKGVQIRIPPNPAWTTTFELLGAVPVGLPFPEVYSALGQGVVEAVEAPVSLLYGNALYEVADQLSLTGHFNTSTMMVMSDELFKGLCKAQQDALLEEFHRGGKEAETMVLERTADFMDKMKEKGVKIVEVDLDGYQAAVKGFFAAFPAWPADLREQMLAAVQKGRAH
jgi:tripartite ATP-independent transporter DctP family solute receptor